MKEFNELKEIFDDANKDFVTNNISLFKTGVSERTLCGALMLELQKLVSISRFSKYHLDVEYNRNIGGKLKTIKKTINGPDLQVITIACDLILHSRGENILQDNLIAIEMKKSTRKAVDKNNDRVRLKCLTSDSFDNIWSYDGKSLPEHVCRYILGVYYEVNLKQNIITIEYYYKGHKVKPQLLINIQQ